MSRYRTYPFGIGATTRRKPPAPGAAAPPAGPAAGPTATARAASGSTEEDVRRASGQRAARRRLPRTTTATRLLLCATAAVLLAVSLGAPAASAQSAEGEPPPERVTKATESDITAVLTQGAPAYTRDSTFTAGVAVTNSGDKPINYLEVRLRLRTPSGRLLYQRTLIHNEATGTVDFDFSRSLADLNTTVKEGRFPLEVRVFATGIDPIQLTDQVLVVDPSRPKVPLVVVARLSGPPMTDPAGRFAVDPGANTAARDAAVALAHTLEAVPALKLTLAVPPYMLEEWLRASRGFQTVGPAGVRPVPSSSRTPQSYAAALRTLSTAVRDPRMELAQVPYGAPDLPALARYRAMTDLELHYARGLSIYRAALEATPSAGSVNASDAFPANAIPILAKRRMEYAVVSTSSLLPQSQDASEPGSYRLRGSQLVGLVTDPAVSAALATSSPDIHEIFDRLFSERSEEGTPAPVVAVVPLGPGEASTVASLTGALGTAARSGWIDVQTAQEAASIPTTQAVTLRAMIDEPPSPPGYWNDVLKGRRQASAFVYAAGEADPDARTALTDSLLSESYAWAGPAGDWSLSDRGRAFAQAAQRTSAAVLSKVGLQVSDVTLSGNGGRLPITVVNGSDKDLRVQVVATSRQVTFPKGGAVTTVVKPGESFVTIPVDLGQGLAGRVDVAVRAGNVQLARSSLTIRASFLNQLAIVAGIVAVLVGLLVYVRGRVRRSQTDGGGRDTARESAEPEAERTEEGDG